MFGTAIEEVATIHEDKGRQEGALEAKMKIAEVLKDSGAELELITKSTGLTVDELEKL